MRFMYVFKTVAPPSRLPGLRIDCAVQCENRTTVIVTLITVRGCIIISFRGTPYPRCVQRRVILFIRSCIVLYAAKVRFRIIFKYTSSDSPTAGFVRYI